jgi:hypothetical protein
MMKPGSKFTEVSQVEVPREEVTPKLIVFASANSKKEEIVN